LPGARTMTPIGTR